VTANSERRREWLARVAFESGLIVLGLIGALALNDWHDRRVRAGQVANALASVRAELESNVASIDKTIAHYTTVIGALDKQLAGGPVYGGAIISMDSLSATAWNAARDAGITSDIPFGVLVTVGHAYDFQSDVLGETRTFLNNVYARSDPDGYRKNPGLLRGILSDFKGHAEQLRARFAKALAALQGAAGA
jgi:hypothetical protein